MSARLAEQRSQGLIVVRADGLVSIVAEKDFSTEFPKVRGILMNTEMRAQITVLGCGTWESSSKASQSPVLGNSPGGLLDQAAKELWLAWSDSNMSSYYSKQHLMRASGSPILCRTPCCQAPSLFASVAKAFFLGWSFEEQTRVCGQAFSWGIAATEKMIEARDDYCSLKQQ